MMLFSRNKPQFYAAYSLDQETRSVTNSHILGFLPEEFYVERRHEPRAESNSRVEITILGEHCIAFPARLLNQSGQGLSLSTDQVIPLNAPVRIDLDDSILLGEVCYSATEGGRYVTGIKLQHLLHGLTDLNRLVAGIMGESWPRRPSQPSRHPALIESQKAG